MQFNKGLNMPGTKVTEMCIYKWIQNLKNDWVTNVNSLFPLEYSNLIHDCRSVMELPWVIKTSRIQREASKFVDLLAKKGAKQLE